jgi:ectoine hydroxylase-related dioxygenase (phytanoyl-CoA dioxygenase family)
MQLKPFTDSTDIADDGTALAARLQQDGYLFIRDLLPRAAVLDVRRQLLEVAAQGGWLKPDIPIEASIAEQSAQCKDPEPDYLKVFKAMWVNEDLHALKHHPDLVGVFECIFGEPVLVHALLVQRNIFPQKEDFDFTTGPHQDRVHIGGGVSYAAWVPLGDCPMAKGPLMVAAGSHKNGVRDFVVASGAGGLEVADPLTGQWVAGDFHAGDVLIFQDTTVHKALPNHTAELRQSFDARYQRASDPVAELSLDTYAGMWSWDEVYAGWKSQELQYYWRRQNPQIVANETRYYEKRDQLAFEMAEKGDRPARDTLLRIIQRDHDPDKRQRAQSLIASLA